jgi:hypothetical protein
MVRNTTLVTAAVTTAVWMALAASLPAQAASSASSASSEGSSASSGSVSDSFQSSSDSSKGDQKVAEGDWRVVAIAAADSPGKLRLTLEGTGTLTGRFELVLPEATAQQAALAQGDVITAKSRSFGWTFARAGAAEPFFLVVHDTKMREFATRKVGA